MARQKLSMMIGREVVSWPSWSDTTGLLYMKGPEARNLFVANQLKKANRGYSIPNITRSVFGCM